MSDRDQRQSFRYASIDWKAMDRDLIVESTLHGQAYAYAVAQCEVSDHRFAGRPGDQACVDYVQSAMQAIGLTGVHVETFPFTAWERGETSLDVLGSSGRMLEALALAGSESAEVDAQLIDAGHGSEDDFQALGEAVEGKIVLVRSDSPAWMKRAMWRGEKVLRAKRYGAAGMLVMNATPGMLMLAGSRGFTSGVDLPSVSVSYESGEWLRRRLALEGAVRLRLKMEHGLREATTFNVIGNLVGRAWPDRCLILGAHYDSHDLCEGARDDAAGVAVAMEIARLLSGLPTGVGRSIRVLAFGAEELGLLGAHAYVDQHHAELSNIDLMLNLDCAGGPGSKDLTVHAWPALQHTLKEVTADVSDLGFSDWISSTHSDHFPFLLAGVPTATLTGNSRSLPDPKANFMHTVADTLDKLDAEDVQMEALRLARAVARLSWVEEWPVERRSSGEVRATLEKAGILESLASEGRFPFPD